MKKLNKDIEEKAIVLNRWILSQKVVQEYQKYEKLIVEHQELKQQEDELKAMQKEIVNKKHQGMDCTQLIKDYESKKESYDQHPLVYNYLSLKQEVNDLILRIQDDINEQLKKKVDGNDKSLYNL